MGTFFLTRAPMSFFTLLETWSLLNALCCVVSMVTSLVSFLVTKSSVSVLMQRMVPLSAVFVMSFTLVLGKLILLE